MLGLTDPRAHVWLCIFVLLLLFEQIATELILIILKELSSLATASSTSASSSPSLEILLARKPVFGGRQATWVTDKEGQSLMTLTRDNVSMQETSIPAINRNGRLQTQIFHIERVDEDISLLVSCSQDSYVP